MLTLTSFRFFSSAIFSRTGATAWQGPHHSAQKSTSTGSPLWMTSCSNVESVTSVAIQFPFSWFQGKKRCSLHFRSRVQAAAESTRPSDHRGGGPRVVGGGRDLRQAAGAERGGTDLLVHRRAGHRQQADARPHGVGADAQ